MIEIQSDPFELKQDFYLERLARILQELNIEGDMVVKLGDKDQSRELNARYRGKDYPTDVLSFPFDEDLPEEGLYLGDIFICYPLAEEQAKENGVTVEEELFTLMVHGVLHLAGYDHEADEGEMEKLQEDLLERFYRDELK